MFLKGKINLKSSSVCNLYRQQSEKRGLFLGVLIVLCFTFWSWEKYIIGCNRIWSEVGVNSPSLWCDTARYKSLDAVVMFVTCEMSGNLLSPPHFVPWKQSWANMKHSCVSHFELLMTNAHLHQRCDPPLPEIL